MLNFVCYPKCSTCQKAKALLDGHGAEYEVRDIKEQYPTYDELKEWLALSELPVKKMFHTSGQLYKSLGLKDNLPTMSEDECLRLLATDGMLVKRPWLVDYDGVLVSFNPDEWEAVLVNMKTAPNAVTIDIADNHISLPME
jgi:arsenate reductase